MSDLNSKKIVVYALNEECDSLVYLKMFDYPDQEAQAKQAFDELLLIGKYSSYMCTQEYFAKVIMKGLDALARAAA